MRPALLVLLLAAAIACTPTGVSEIPAGFTPPPDTSALPLPTRTSSPSGTRLPRIAATPLRMAAPALGIDVAVRDGSGLESAPAGTALRLLGTAKLGQGGNAYLYARATSGGFERLWDAKSGDSLTVTFDDGSSAVYTVSEVHPLVMPTDLRWVHPTAEERLTLQASVSDAPEAPKLIVIARRVQ